MMKIAVTGANSSVGQNLLEQLKTKANINVVAGVRNEKAFASLPQAKSIKPQIIAYDDLGSLQATMTDADCVIHLAGILIETKHSNYASANIAATAAVIALASLFCINCLFSETMTFLKIYCFMSRPFVINHDIPIIVYKSSIP